LHQLQFTAIHSLTVESLIGTRIQYELQEQPCATRAKFYHRQATPFRVHPSATNAIQSGVLTSAPYSSIPYTKV